MENQFEVLKQQIKDNINRWYPKEENIEYFVINNLCKENEEELINIANNMTEDSRILILMDNGLSVKNISVKEKESENLYTRKEIEELLNKLGLIYRKFYYPLPDNNITNVIFTDKHLPDEETISRNITLYSPEQIEKNEQNSEFIKIIRQNPELFKIFANSFFIECSKSEFKDNEIEFVSFSNMRKEKYRINTIIKGEYVYKGAINDKALEHILNVKKNIDLLRNLNLNTLDSYDDIGIISEYQRDRKTLDKVIIEKIKMGQNEEASNLINDLFDELKNKLLIVKTEKNVFDQYQISYEETALENLTFVKYGFWDMIFQNIFYINEQYYFYDQEWLEENIPLEYIVYRAFLYNQELARLIKKEEIYTRFNIKEEQIKLFRELDNKLQEKTRDENVWNIHSKPITINTLLEKNRRNEEEIQKLLKDKEQITQDCNKLLNEKDARIKFLEGNMAETVNLLHAKERRIELIEASTSWRITEPLRWLRRNKKGKK